MVWEISTPQTKQTTTTLRQWHFPPLIRITSGTGRIQSGTKHLVAPKKENDKKGKKEVG
jgi:hypothetical protein